MAYHFIILGDVSDNASQLLTLANRVLRCAGLGKAETVEDEADEPTQQVLVFLTEVQQELYDGCGKKRFGHSEWLQEVVVGDGIYSFVDNFLGMRARPTIGEVKLKYYPIDRLRREFDDHTEAGAPAYYSYDNEQVILSPVPDATFMAQRLVLHGGVSYLCIKPHTAGEDDDEPGAGGNTAVYWVVTTSQTAVTAWESGGVYKSGRLSIPFYSTPMQLTGNGTFTVLNPEFYPALVQGACWRMKDWLGRKLGEVDRAERRYQGLFDDRVAASRLVHDLAEREVENLGEPEIL